MVAVIEVALIVALTVTVIIGLNLLYFGLKRRLLNPSPVMRDHDYAFHEIQPQLICELFDYKIER